MNDDINSKRNPYINKEGRSELRQSIIAFIDILGFKELVRSARNGGKSQEVFINFYQILSDWYKRIDDMHGTMFEMPFVGGKKDPYKIRIFTDCILIGCPINKKVRGYNFIEGCEEFYKILAAIYLFQMEMVNHGYFIRGAIAVDELYMDEVIIYGNGAIEAYEAEVSKAKYPRIILTESAASVFAEISKSFKDQQTVNYINQFFFKDNDGHIFLSYLESIKIGESDFEFVSDLATHKEIIEFKLVEYKNRPHFLEKYLWVARYHNNFCNQPPYYYEYIIDLNEYQMQPI